MSFLEILSAIVAGAGTMASILGIFFAVYTKKNGRMTRELVERMEERTKDEHRQTREHIEKLIKQENKLTRELIERMIERMNKRFDEGLRYIASLIEKIDERAEKRHLELAGLFQANPPRRPGKA